jgi:hypothetical protein
VDGDSLRSRLKRARRGGRRCPRELREAVLEYSRAAKREGKTDVVVASELGMSPGTLQCWRSMARRGRLMPVTIVSSPAATPDVVVECGRVRVRGLDLEGVAELLKRLA